MQGKELAKEVSWTLPSAWFCGKHWFYGMYELCYEVGRTFVLTLCASITQSLASGYMGSGWNLVWNNLLDGQLPFQQGQFSRGRSFETLVGNNHIKYRHVYVLMHKNLQTHLIYLSMEIPRFILSNGYKLST